MHEKKSVKGKLRSSLEFGVAWAERKALLKGLGLSDDDLLKPHIAIINSWSDMNPGHKHLRTVAEEVHSGVTEAGGLPFNFNTIGLCDGIAFVGSEYILPSRDLIVNEVEVIIEAYKFDAMVMIATCDKIVPAYMMAAARLDIPAIIVTGGYMPSGKLDGRNVTFVDVGRSIGESQSGKISRDDVEKIINRACPGPGACPIMGTANTMCITAEAIGMSLPGNSTLSALSDELNELASTAGKQILDLWREGITARKIITPESVGNAIKVAMAIGGSTNALIHISAIAAEAELGLDCGRIFDEVSHHVPLLIGISPNGEHLMDDFDKAGGLGALIKEISDFIELDALTTTGKTFKENIKNCSVKDSKVIRSINNPISTEGALVVLHGNIASDGALVKQSAIPPNLMKFRGPSKVYSSNESAIEALRNDEIEEGDAVIIIFQGAKGGPGLISTFPFTSELAGSKFLNSVALITDGRFSGATEGACIGYVSPEAALYGPILAIRDGDIIEYDIANRTLNVDLPQEEIDRRLKKAEIEIDIKRGYLGIYQRTVRSIFNGAVLSGRK